MSAISPRPLLFSLPSRSQNLWSMYTPLAAVLAICIFESAASCFHKKPLTSLISVFQPLLSIHEAEALVNGESFSSAKIKQKAPLRLTLALSVVAFIETVFWSSSFIRSFIHQTCAEWGLFALAFSWFYASVKPVLRPTYTPPYDLLFLYLTLQVSGIYHFGCLLLQWSLADSSPPATLLAFHTLNVAFISTLIVIVLSRPVAEPPDEPAKSPMPSAPENSASLWSWLTYGWMNPLIKQGTYNTLNEDDVPSLSVTGRAKPVFLKFNTFNQKSLPWKLFMANSLDLLVNFIGSVLSVVLNYSGPYFLRKIIRSMEDMTPERRAEAYVTALLMLASQVLKAIVDGQQLWALRRAATRLRSELMSAIYEKALKRRDFSGITGKAAGKVTTEDDGKTKKGKKKGKADGESGAGADIGKIISLMASDTSVIVSLVSGLNQIYGAPFEIIIACMFLYQLMGWSAFVGFGVILIVWPLNVALSRRATKISKGTMSARDKRLSVLNELINAVKPIKFFAWEDRWINRVLDAREAEMRWIRKARTNSIMLQALWTTAPILVSVVSFFVYVMRKNDLDVATAFTAITLFTMIKQPLNTIPTWVVQLLRTRVSVNRIETFLGEDEVPEQVSMLKRAQDDPSKFSSDALGFRDASFKWNAVTEQSKLPKNDSPHISPDVDVANGAPERKFELHDLNVIFPEGKLTVVTGPTASGKTAVILALLGEMTLLPGGDILLPKEPGMADEHGLTRSISYAAQSPWLQHMTIKDNILFGSPFHEERYKQVIECCALLPDLQILEDGGETEIGARGINLSGGQKARVALARAAYARTKYVLLDDPLSAVDSPTARHLYEKLLCGPIMQHRTVILVTHHVDLVLPRAHYLIRMNNGRIELQGEITDLQKSGEIGPILANDTFENEIRSDTNIRMEPKAAETPIADSIPKTTKGTTPKKLVEAEAREVGRIRWSIYRDYLKASFPYKVWAVAFLVTALIQGVGFIEKFWIKTWGEAYGKEASPSSDAYQTLDTFNQVLLSSPSIEVQGLPSAEAHPLFYVGVYALIGLITVILSVLASSLQYIGAIRASRKLFRQLLNSIVHATMRWHDITPTGRILNRFSKDIETIDASISGSFRSVYTTIASFVTSMVIVIAVFPPFVFPAVLIGYLYYRVAIGYLNTSRHLRRMESTTRSPIFSGFGELLDGIVTVRAFSVEQRFLNDLHTRVDLTLKMFYYFWMTNRWLLLNFDCLGALAVFSTTIFALSLHSNDTENWAGWAALCITSAMTFTSRIYWACRYWTRLELDLNSVERIVEYLDIPQEPASIIEGHRPPAYWPSATGPNSEVMLHVQDLEVRYAPNLPSVLSNISFSVKATERIGIVGRTGSGKSTLAMSILRFIDPVNGKIVIDGIDISEIGIYDLRSRLTFIPQDATLFSGSIKNNIDPFGDYSEAECLDALRRVHMITDEAEEIAEALEQPAAGESVSTVSDGASLLSGTTLSNSTHKVTKLSLTTEVSAGGTNFSAGQRQLIAMARAILRQSSIVILDEATSSIDFETDNKIQTAIREEFKSSLLLTIAHRLMTVIDYDRLLVLDAGRLVEFDTPDNLIKREGGVFRDMCAKSGSFVELERIAKEKVVDEH